MLVSKCSNTPTWEIALVMLRSGLFRASRYAHLHRLKMPRRAGMREISRLSANAKCCLLLRKRRPNCANRGLSCLRSLILVSPRVEPIGDRGGSDDQVSEGCRG